MAKIRKSTDKEIPNWLKDESPKAVSLNYGIKERVSSNYKDSIIYLSVSYSKKSPKTVSLGLNRIKKGTLNAQDWSVKDDANTTKVLQNLRSKCQTIEADLRISGNELDETTFINLLFGNMNLRNLKPSFGEVIKMVGIDHYQKLEGIAHCAYTTKRYARDVEHIYNFLRLKFNTIHVPLSKINQGFAHDFWLHMKSELKWADDTVRKFVGFMRRVFIYANANGWVGTNPFMLIKNVRTKKTILYLTETEVKNLQSTVFLTEIYQETKDLALFQIETGLAYADLMELAPNHIKTDTDGTMYIFKSRFKTSNDFGTILTNNALEILKKYAKHPLAKLKGTCFPPITNQEYNRRLKEVGRVVGIETKITTHLLRKTFSTLSVNRGLSKDSLQYALGHTSVKTTEMYYAKTEVKRVLEEQKKVMLKNAKNTP